MADKVRPHQETKEIGIKRLKEVYEKNNGKVCDSKQTEKFIKLYEKEILPQCYKE